MKTSDVKASKSHLCQKLDNNIVYTEYVLSIHSILSSNTFTSNSLNPSLSPFRNVGTWVPDKKMLILKKKFRWTFLHLKSSYEHFSIFRPLILLIDIRMWRVLQ